VSLQSIVEAARPDGAREAQMVIRIDAESWPFRQEGDNRLASFDVVGFAYDLQGKLIDGFSKTYNVRLNSDRYSAMLRNGMNLREAIGIGKKKLCNIRVAVVNRDTEEIGTASQWLESKP
jgi:hypothetical protein